MKRAAPAAAHSPYPAHVPTDKRFKPPTPTPNATGTDLRAKINVGGTGVETTWKTLMQAGYFQRLHRQLAAPGKSLSEECFIDRDATLFLYVLDFLRTGQVSGNLFQSDAQLWHSLRREAAFFEIDGLTSYLNVTHRCRFLHTGDRQGVLYWLGCDRGKSYQYSNPHKSRILRVESSTEVHLNEQSGNCVSLAQITDLACVSDQSKEEFVQHNPDYKLTDLDELALSSSFPSTLPCDVNFGKVDQSWTRVDLLRLRLRPTHYTLGLAECLGASCWNFSGSIDGVKWDVLHRARDEGVKFSLSEKEVDIVKDAIKKLNFPSEAGAVALSKRVRYTWKIDVPEGSFYRFFRVSSIGASQMDALPASENVHGCLHVCGLELYGDVNESWM